MWDPASVQAIRHLFNCGADSGFYAEHHKLQQQTPQKQQIKNNDTVQQAKILARHLF